MISRSVPGYETVVAMSGLLAGRFAKPETAVYDLGCSLGATTFSMRRHLEGRGCRIVAVDNSPAMITRCRELLDADSSSVQVELREDDILSTDIRNASMVVLNWTLQFVPLAARLALLSRIADALIPGGMLVLSEKVIFPDDTLHQLNIDLHHDFKRAHGYSEMEIAGKRDSLENVLVPESLPQHHQRLREAGFRSSEVWFQCFNFASIVAIK
jgi:tRNA (cmo5U34)-methyltransferase